MRLFIAFPFIFSPRVPPADNSAKIDCTKSRNSLLCRGKRGDKLVVAAALTAGSPSSAMLPTGGPLLLSSDVPVQIVDHPVNVVVNESAAAIFNCGFQSLVGGDSGPLVLKWRKDGKVIRKWDSGAVAGAGSAAAELDGETTESSMYRDDGEFVVVEFGGYRTILSCFCYFFFVAGRIHVDKNNGSLMFNSVIASDEGSYDCQVTNNGSEFLVTSNAAELQIICK